MAFKTQYSLWPLSSFIAHVANQTASAATERVLFPCRVGESFEADNQLRCSVPTPVITRLDDCA